LVVRHFFPPSVFEIWCINYFDMHNARSGEAGGRSGTFPGSYVQPIAPSSKIVRLDAVRWWRFLYFLFF
jgi:hypothetical protein